jgi:hypothetical protein
LTAILNKISENHLLGDVYVLFIAEIFDEGAAFLFVIAKSFFLLSKVLFDL